MIRTHLYSLQLDRISPGQFCVVTAALALYVPDQFWLLLAQPWYFMTRPYSSNHGRWMNTLLCGEIFSAIWWDLVRFCEIWWDLVRYGEMLWHWIRIGKILRYMVRFSEIQWDMVRFSEFWWDMARAGEIHVWWDLVRFGTCTFGAIWYI